MTSDDADLLTATDLGCRRGGRRVFSGVGLRLRAGQALWLRGANGSGKTSLLRLLAGLAPAASGRIDRQAPVAYLGHSNALKDELNVGEALRFLCSLHGPVPEEARLRAVLERVGLGRRLAFPVRKLSQGQRRKLALARLWLGEARIWLLDEPYDALDREACALLDQVLQDHRQAGGAVVLTSHQAVHLPGLETLDLSAAVS
ncbi:heme ABC exporter ATP-binding protein CcmA [Ideonella alba]|uniref:heme ABC exporter ATP-binding protein CcmA n=1 Tax=Ideonella alba TaxID=2824118 RepID=UPI001FFCBA63|nr:heme ABC exporter ATP-binding protein CcmA [Ideonella alba]